MAMSCHRIGPVHMAPTSQPHSTVGGERNHPTWTTERFAFAMHAILGGLANKIGSERHAKANTKLRAMHLNGSIGHRSASQGTNGR